ncbi:MAG TPA: DMT family transporter [Chthoniobacterales bacterium]|jgi:drug/metabolite transporter (DMT)-like permease|nr:DMT family transporter [Chthoniobacterales bacterium]
MRVLILTVVAMIAFASNSLLCRVALKQTAIDPASFTFVRILSGAVALWLILQSRRKLIVDRIRRAGRPADGLQSPVGRRVSDSGERESTAPPLVESSSSGSSLVTGHWSLQNGNWPSALALFVYAAGFSFAYVDLSAGTGALLLFGAVQATMILWGFHKGERLDPTQLAGIVIALIGLVVLVFPRISAPPLISSIFMLAAGIAWGVYSLRGKTAADATATTTGNFLRAVPIALLVSLIMLPTVRSDSLGTLYAVISGAITSGIGYVIWYAALTGLKAASAATVQLSVPVLAATGGILLLHEPITVRYVIASIAVLGGILLVVIEKQRTSLPVRTASGSEDQQ